MFLCAASGKVYFIYSVVRVSRKIGFKLSKISYNEIIPWNKSPLLCPKGMHGFVYSRSESVHLAVLAPSPLFAYRSLTSRFTGG